MSNEIENASKALKRNFENPSVDTVAGCWQAFLEIPDETYAQSPNLRSAITKTLKMFEWNIKHDRPVGAQQLKGLAEQLADKLMDVYVREGPLFVSGKADESVFDYLVIVQSRLDPNEYDTSVDSWSSEEESD